MCEKYVHLYVPRLVTRAARTGDVELVDEVTGRSSGCLTPDEGGSQETVERERPVETSAKETSLVHLSETGLPKPTK